MSVVYGSAALRRRSAAPPAAAVAVTVGSALVGVNASVTVPVVVARTNYSGDVVLSATGLPAFTTASFNPATLGPGVTASVLTVTTTASATPSVTNATVVAVPDRLATINTTCPITITNASGIFASVVAARYDAGSGSTPVSGGVALGPTSLLRTDLSKVVLDIGGTEHACFVEALGKDYAGGYVRSLLVQSVETINGTGTISGVLRVLASGSPLTRLTKVTPSSLPVAMWHCGSAAEMCAAKGVFGANLVYTSWDLSNTYVRQFAESYEADVLLTPMTGVRGTASYESAMHAFGYYAATANRSIMRLGLTQAKGQCDNPAWNDPGPPPVYKLNDWYLVSDSIMVAYLLTGADNYWRYLNRMSEDFAYRYAPLSQGGQQSNPGSPLIELRGRSRGLQILQAADNVGITDPRTGDGSGAPNPNWNIQTWLPYHLNNAINCHVASGQYCWVDSPRSAKWYMTLYHIIALQRAVGRGYADSAIVAKLDTALTDAWTYYNAGWPYVTPQVPNQPPGTGYPNAYWIDGPGLNPAIWANGFGFYAYAWMYGKTGVAHWKTKALTIMQDLMAPGGYPTYKADNGGRSFDEIRIYWTEAMAALSGVTY